MNSSKFTIILACLVFLFLTVMHLRVIKPEKGHQEKSVLYSFDSDKAKSDGGQRKSKRRSFSSKQKKSINDASLGDIISVDGFGEKFGRRIIEKRDEEGLLDEEKLLSITGIGEARLLALKKHFLIPGGPGKDKKIASLSPVCPVCKTKMDLHNRRKQKEYIYCPHCLSYLPDVQKTENR